MTWEEYWYGDVWMVEAAREAEKLKQRRINAEAHLMGMYVYEAIYDVSPVLHAFAKKGVKPIPYRTNPYPLNEKKSKPGPQEAENERLRAILFFKNWARATEKNFGNRS